MGGNTKKMLIGVVIAIVIVAAFIDVPILVERCIVGTISFLVIKIALNILMILKRVFAIFRYSIDIF